MRVLMVGVDENTVGGMLTVVQNYQKASDFCDSTHLEYIATATRAGAWGKIKKMLLGFARIAFTIRKHDIDIVHVHMSERGSVFREGFVVLLANTLGSKTIIHMHGAEIETWYKNQWPLVRKLIRYIFCSADRMLILGTKWRPFISEVMQGQTQKIKVLRNAVHVESSNMACASATDILFYGALIKRKGVDDLLQAFAAIKDEIPTMNLRLYGDDQDYRPIEKISEFGLEGRASYGGWVTPDNREQVFANTLVNVLPSYNEGLPMTILESMGYGIPNISTNIAAIPEAVDDGVNGFLVRPGDVEALKQRLLKLCTDKELWQQFSNNAHTKAYDFFSLDSHIKRLLSIYDELLADHSHDEKGF
ncbi:glycosyltransferase family 4 protein [Bifidobacterium eulemuris]|uniref:Glycosyltransferase family 4 protein n=1 Tax=Bifidobacterium eulemuris TaxID=1765219 RepID=A0A261GBJ8_9BIFI|nr:glycosyltransferase family 4 protein [Bifidobacterium eulemuris]OZG68545.1 glycosyltransferase, group 1 family protein [Bifidobacterium eulemuris]QOL32675.1 glycosyltransferase family 4 protein [Bifidobacterium eulemuris]